MKRLTLFVLSLFLLASCKKDKGCKKDRAGISGVYRKTAMLYKANSASAETDVYVQEVPDSCNRDDVYNLKADGMMVFTDAGLKCWASNSYSSGWSVIGDTFSCQGFPNTIESYNCSTLIFIETDNYVVGDQMRIVFTRQ